MEKKTTTTTKQHQHEKKIEKKEEKKAAVYEAPLLLKIKQAINKTTNSQQPTTPLLYNA
jgi:hypothetical protein